jgi:hypothetical protein
MRIAVPNERHINPIRRMRWTGDSVVVDVKDERKDIDYVPGE